MHYTNSGTDNAVEQGEAPTETTHINQNGAAEPTHNTQVNPIIGPVVESPPQSNAYVKVTNLTYIGTKFTYYQGINLTLDSLGLHNLIMPTSLSSTVLLLSLAGRIKPTTGTIVVGHATKLTTLQKYISLANFPQIDTLSPDATIKEVLEENNRWFSRWFSPKRNLDHTEITPLLQQVFGQQPAPAPETYIGQLDQKDQFLLRVTLALLQKRPMLVIGDVDQISNENHRQYVLKQLATLGEKMLIVTSSSTPSNENIQYYYEHAVDLFTIIDPQENPAEHTITTSVNTPELGRIPETPEAVEPKETHEAPPEAAP